LSAKYVAHLKSLVGIQKAADMEDLNTDEWRHMPETDQVVSVDPMDIVISAGHKGVTRRLLEMMFRSARDLRHTRCASCHH